MNKLHLLKIALLIVILAEEIKRAGKSRLAITNKGLIADKIITF